MKLRFCVMLCLALAVGPPVSAQIPSIALDGLVGLGQHNHAIGPYPLETGPLGEARAALTIRLGTSGTVRPILKAEYAAHLGGDPVTVTCSSCVGAFPATGGYGFTLGVQAMAGKTLDLAALLGAGRFGGSYHESRHTNSLGDVEAARHLGEHASVVLNVPYRQWSESGFHYWFVPLTVGGRLFQDHEAAMSPVLRSAFTRH